MNRFLQIVAAAAIVLGVQSPSHAALFTTSFGTNAGTPSNCDDCNSGPWNFTGVGQDINFFGNTYSGLYIGSNGYVTFGGGANNYVSNPLNTESILPMIAGSFTDLDSRSDVASNVYINNSTAGQIIATWDMLGHYSTNYTVRSTFQVVVRSDQFAIGSGEGQIGFFYASMTDPSSTSAGFGDGLAAVNPGEVAFLSLQSGTLLSNNAPRWYNLNNGAPDPEPVPVPEPGSLALLGLALAGIAGLRRRKMSAQA